MSIKDDLSYDEWFGIFIKECQKLGYSDPIDKYGVESYYDVDEETPEHAAKLFVKEMLN